MPDIPPNISVGMIPFMSYGNPVREGLPSFHWQGNGDAERLTNLPMHVVS